MKYIISEQQNDRLKKIMFHFLDSYLTPFGGWKPEKLQKELNDRFGDNELFIPLIDLENQYDEDWDDTEHIFYSSCENPNYNYKRNGDCPEVLIPDHIFDMLNDSFGEKIWKPVFFEWFTERSSLPVVRIRKFDGD
jgi:hypothetical protein